MTLKELKPWIEIALKSSDEKMKILKPVKSQKLRIMVALLLELSLFHPSRPVKKRGLEDSENRSDLMCQFFEYACPKRCPLRIEGINCDGFKHPFDIAFRYDPRSQISKKAMDRYYQHINNEYSKAYWAEFGKG